MVSVRCCSLFLISFPVAAQAEQALYTAIGLLSLALALVVIGIIKLKYRLTKLLQSHNIADKTVLGFYSLHDDISGFPNKFFLQQQLDELLKRAPERSFSLLLMKISQFDKVNQLLGHSNSNLVLAQIAQRI